MSTTPPSPLDAIPQHDWDALARKRIYFGHQSVGYDILKGVESILKSKPAIALRVVDSADPRELDRPGLVHSKVGSNCDPDSKLQAFANALAAGVGERADFAFLKFCYVDIEHETDVEALFTRYASAFSDLERRFPRVRFLHVTVPLTSRPTGLKSLIKTKLGKPLWGDEQNKRRHHFNERLRAHIPSHAGDGHLFDLARIESTTTSGQPHTYAYQGSHFPSLIPAFTHDGGHLNANGKSLLAREFLRFLAQVPA